MKLVLSFIAALSFSLLACSQESGAKLLSPEAFKKEISNTKVQLVDVRTADEYKAGHIANAINIDYFSADFKKKINELDKTKPVYIYCQVGGRSAKAAAIFISAGFKQVFDLQGGYSHYTK